MIIGALAGAVFMGVGGLLTAIGERMTLRAKIAVVAVFAVSGAAIGVATMAVTRYVTGVIADEAYSHVKEAAND